MLDKGLARESPRLPDHDLGLDESAGALLEEKGLPCVRSMRSALRGSRSGRLTQEVWSSSSAPRGARDRDEPARSTSGLAQPWAVLGSVVDEQEDPRAPQASTRRLRKVCGLGVDPVEILEHQQERPHPALPDEDPAHSRPA
jgi:hypothetical protein